MTEITSKLLKNSLGYDKTGSFDSGAGEGGSEVVAYLDGTLYVTNGAEDRIDLFDAESQSLITSLDLTLIADYAGVNSVAVSAAGVAVAVEREGAGGETMTGVVAVYPLDAVSGDLPAATIEVGNLPDMVTFSKDGAYIFVANEGEPKADGDPAGSISVIEVATMTATTVGFEAFDSQIATLEAAGVRIFPGVLPSTDFEPEYIAEGPDGTLYVTLQEANAVAVFDLETMSFTEILPLGTADHSEKGHGIDPNDKDDAINIHTVDVEGLRMPDAIATAEIGGKTYFLTANEGDDRGDFDEGGDAARVEDILAGDVPGVSIDPDAYTAAELEDLARLTVSIIDGDTDGDGDIDVLHSYGSRSFTIYDTDGNVVFDSGDDFETLIAELRPANAFNNDDYPSDDPDVVDENRSDNKGPEPEAIAVGEVDGKMLAFIGLERDGGVMIYDISNPKKASFVDYIDSSVTGDASPEVIKFIAAEDSETGVAQIAVSYEISGTTALYDLAFGHRFNGTNDADEITGTVGDDTLVGHRGADVLDGGAGDDLLKGQKGTDTLIGGTGNDVMKGGAGADTFVFDLGDGEDTIVSLGKRDVIDLSATGLDFADLTITATGGNDYTVAYGDEGDVISLTLNAGNTVLDADDFLF
ncbi:choice-of-anchor I family protein [Pseudodonghicola flavimaris]|uniref:Choice-of-anchor I family protein n=1 Tax=Pseudodonghicola flavimaris TaxID=3050036 RepID=A0ABT7F000_9RHOB|nr:choice-of-anchor I family protein [Pseudodonghicola flavimaris]MDK3017931.1 choice-of-anchor I family protein [Pseudodonghicola flavimaris]